MSPNISIWTWLPWAGSPAGPLDPSTSVHSSKHTALWTDNTHRAHSPGPEQVWSQFARPTHHSSASLSMLHHALFEPPCRWGGRVPDVTAKAGDVSYKHHRCQLSHGGCINMGISFPKAAREEEGPSHLLLGASTTSYCGGDSARIPQSLTGISMPTIILEDWGKRKKKNTSNVGSFQHEYVYIHSLKLSSFHCSFKTS